MPAPRLLLDGELVDILRPAATSTLHRPSRIAITNNKNTDTNTMKGNNNMSAEPNTAETSDPAPAPVSTAEPAHRADNSCTAEDTPNVDTAQPDGEAALREWEGLPANTSVLVPTCTTSARQPEAAWALLVQAVDIVGDVEHGQEVELFAGSWLADQPPADLFDGDLVVRITPQYNTCATAGLDMLLARHGRWNRVGAWQHHGTTWPVTLAPAAATIMELTTDIIEVSARHDAATPATSPLGGSEGGALRALLDAGLVKPGEGFLWERRNASVRHVVRVRPDGALVLADGRAFATPTGAATALCGYPQNGWGVFWRLSDGRSLSDLRTTLRTQRGQ